MCEDKNMQSQLVYFLIVITEFVGIYPSTKLKPSISHISASCLFVLFGVVFHLNLARNADLLIHEATFGDAFYRDAELKTHSTTSQAMEVAKRAQAKFTLLTHFSNRYVRVPDHSPELMEASNVGIAYDNMIVSMGH